MKVTKKTRLLAAMPIAQSQDGTVKVFSFKDNGNPAEFTYGHNWIAKSEGLKCYYPPTDEEWIVEAAFLTGPGDMMIDIFPTAQDDGKKLTFCGRDDLKPEAGQYEGCQIYLGLAKGDSPEREAVYIPMGKLIVE